MKEYKVMMKLGNEKWVRGRRPNVMTLNKTFKTTEEAQVYMDSCSEAWNVYIEKCRKIGHRLLEQCLPVEWKIMSREVSEWKAE